MSFPGGLRMMPAVYESSESECQWWVLFQFDHIYAIFNLIIKSSFAFYIASNHLTDN